MEVAARRGFRTAMRAVALRAGHARFELMLLALLGATIAAVVWQDAILQRTVTLTPETVVQLSRMPHTDKTLNGNSTAAEKTPFVWSCTLRQGFDYPYCGYEIFLGHNRSEKGLNLANLKSLTMTMTYRGPSKSFRVYLKNFDKRYATNVVDDSPKINRVEDEIPSGREVTVAFDVADFGVADWWLFKHKLPPDLSHPQFDNITSIDVQTGTDNALGRHEFKVREIVIRKAILSDAQWYLSLLGGWVMLIGAYLGYRFHTLHTEIARRREMQALALAQAEEAEAAARQDHLTKVLNRRGVAEQFADLARSPSGKGSLGVILIDIDRFKTLNDSFGHGYGDDVLSTIATLLRRNVRPDDTVGRWGGEEFLVLCPAIDQLDAQRVAEKLRRRIEHYHFGDCEKVTVSLGVHWVETLENDLPGLVSRADIALYSAKRAGRNCARMYRPGMAKAAA